MNQSLKIRLLQGVPVIHDIRNANVSELFHGLPKIEDKECLSGCTACSNVCPTNAITLNPVKIDLGKCVFCPLCEEACPEKIIHFTTNYKLVSADRKSLIIDKTTKQISPEVASEKIRKYFGKSLKLRQVSAGGCNGCELELNACSNVNFDLGRYGIEFVASPRHADGIVITGPLTKHMSLANQICYDAVPNPKVIILFGACAISGGVFQNSTKTEREFLSKNKIDLFVPGCPPHPLTFINGLLDWLDRK